MHITSLSPAPHKPCILLQWPNVSILLDCPLEISTFFTFIPHVYQSNRLKNAHTSRRFNLNYLKEIGNRVYVEGVPEIHHVSLDSLQMSLIDAILISNYDSLMALPFYTEGTGFAGHVYVTDIALQFGRLIMEEMIEYFDRIDFPPIDNQWKRDDICTKFPNPPFNNPIEWQRFYSTKEMNNSLSKVITLSYNQTIEVHRVQITPICSGFNFGSANWTIKTENEKIAYLSSSGDIPNHVKRIDLVPLKTCDYMLVTSLTRLVDAAPNKMANSLLIAVTDTLKRGGNVLLPMNPVGPIFEVLEAVSNVIDETTGISVDTPIYLISPMAKAILAVASISAEWMSEDRQNCVYRPEEPFKHSHLIKSGRLRVYDSLYGAFSKEYKTPCVMLTGHPSLRIGDAAHMVEVWGSDSKNAVILTDPDLMADDVRDPFRTLPIRFIHCPMDFRLNFGGLHNILGEVKPKYVLIPSPYLKPMIPGRPDLMLQYGMGNVTPLGYDEPILLSKLSKNKKKLVNVRVHPDVTKSLKFKCHPTKSNLVIAPVSCHLSCYNNDFELLPLKVKEPEEKVEIDKINVKKMVKIMEEKKMENIEVKTVENETTIVTVGSEEMAITVVQNGKRVKITAENDEKRKMLLEIIKESMKEEEEKKTAKIKK